MGWERKAFETYVGGFQSLSSGVDGLDRLRDVQHARLGQGELETASSVPRVAEEVVGLDEGLVALPEGREQLSESSLELGRGRAELFGRRSVRDQPGLGVAGPVADDAHELLSELPVGLGDVQDARVVLLHLRANGLAALVNLGHAERGFHELEGGRDAENEGGTQDEP